MIVFNLTRQNLLSLNDRDHWSRRSAVTSHLRTMSKLQHRNALNGGDYHPFDRARLVVWVAWPDNRRRDVHNILSTIKALVDGAVDAGMIPDDSDQYLQGPDLRVEQQHCKAPFAARLEFVWTDAELEAA